MVFKVDKLISISFAIPFSTMSSRMLRGYFRVLELLNVTFVWISDIDSVLMLVYPIAVKGFTKRISVSIVFPSMMDLISFSPCPTFLFPLHA